MRVNGIGPKPCDYLICGEGPGFNEQKSGIPFVGKTGEELDRYLDGSNLPSRSEVFLTNLYREFHGKDYKYTEEDLQADEPDLLEELKVVRPKLIVTLGRPATRYFLGDVDMDSCQGLPWWGVICNDCGKPVKADSSRSRRLLEMVGTPEIGRVWSSLNLLQREINEGTQSNISDVRGRTRVAQGSRSHLQSYVVPKSRARCSSNSTAQCTTSVSAKKVLSKRTPASDVLSPQDASQESTRARSISTRVPGVQESSETPVLGKSEGQAECCETCGSHQFRTIVVFAVVHPAAGMHNPEMSPYVVAGFKELVNYIDGKTEARRLYDDPYPNTTYEEISTETQLRRALSGLQRTSTLSIDTEGWPGNPWSLQFSCEPGTAYLIRATRRDLLGAFAAHLHRVRPRIAFHSALHDLGVGRTLGIDFAGLPYDDTMIMAYLLQIEPQGLKPGCLRHCNMRMMDYSEVVGDISNDLARDYLTWLWDLEQVEYEEEQQAEFDRRRAAGRRIKVLPKLPKTPLHKAVTRIIQSKRPRELWEEQVEDIQVAGYNRLGALPEATLDYVSPSIAIPYGCRDADGTGRLLDQYGRRIDAMGLRATYELELATYPLIDRMQRVGVLPDLAHFKELSALLEYEIGCLQSELERVTGLQGFNANSGDQVAAYLFGTLGLEEVKLTKSGRGSTNDKILEALEHEHPEHPVLSVIREYRETYKLKNTFCLAPSTKVLTYDLRWVEIESLQPGDKLLGFDEDGKMGEADHHRHWRSSEVVSTTIVEKPCYRLTFSDGTSVVCSTDHQWLARSQGTYQKATWLRSDKLLTADRPAQTRHDCSVIKPLSVWESTACNQFDAGYLSGIADGEGCLQRPKWSMRLAITQRLGLVEAKTKQLLKDFGFKFSSHIDKKTGIDHFIVGVTSEVIRFLGMFRPVRLLDKWNRLSENLPRMNMRNAVHVVSRKYVGVQKVVALETTTRTFIAEGLASHNCDRLPDFVHRWPFDGRIHATFRTTRVVTGRLASSDPNLLAQPEHGKWAEEFKRGWVAGPDHYICAWDESQIELRGLAHLSRDPLMCAVFRGEKRNPDGSLIDLHAALAERIFGVKPALQDKHKHRLPAKAINFGIPMGMTNRGLSVELRKNGVEADEDTAQRWLDETLGLYKGVAAYMEERKAEARRQGFVRCLSGRIRYIGGIRSRDERIREEAERFAFSTPIQESAQFVMKQAEKSVYEDILVPYWKDGVWVEPLLQVHDCLRLECQQGLEQELHQKMTKAMTNVPKGFIVPLAVEGEYGENMADVTKFK